MVGGWCVPILRSKPSTTNVANPLPVRLHAPAVLQRIAPSSAIHADSSSLFHPLDAPDIDSQDSKIVQRSSNNSVLLPSTSSPSSPQNPTYPMSPVDEKPLSPSLIIQKARSHGTVLPEEKAISCLNTAEVVLSDNRASPLFEGLKPSDTAPLSAEASQYNQKHDIVRPSTPSFHPFSKPTALNLDEIEAEFPPIDILSLPPLNKTHKIRRAKSETFLLNPTKQLEPLAPRTRPPFLPLPVRTQLPPTCNHAAALSFAQKIVTAVNDAAVCTLISIGHQLGLFAVLQRLAPHPHPAHVIASSAVLRIRPVAEWLAAMACAGVVDTVPYCGNDDDGMRAHSQVGNIADMYDSDTLIHQHCYVLPAEHTPWLTWGAGTNLALLCQSVPALARVEHAVVSCYKRGTGLDRSVYASYERILAYDVMQTVGLRILAVLRLAPSLLDKLSSGICVLCIGGAADAVYVRLARMFPRSWFTCYGSSERHAAAARKTVEDGGVTNVHFKTVRRMDDLREKDSYDATLVLEGGGIRECDNPVAALRAIRQAMRNESCIVYVEMMGAGDVETDRKNRVGTFLYAVAAFYSVPKAMADGRVGEAVSGIWGHVNVRNAMCDAGFEDISIHALEDDSLNCVLVAKTPNSDEPQAESS